jgi:hypothetical protein
MNKAIQEGSGSEDYGARSEASCVLELNPQNLPILNYKVGNDALSEMQIRGKFKHVAHLSAIESPVGLRTWSLDGRTSGTVEKAELNTRAVNNASHDAAESVNFPHQMTFGDPSDGRVT